MRRKLLNGKMVGMLAVILVLCMAVGVAEGMEIKDKSKKWLYTVEHGGAMIGWGDHSKGPSGKLAIPTKVDQYAVHGLRNYAFSGCDRLTHVTIPEGVTNIGDSAFFSCTKLTSITIPASVTSIGTKAFAECFSGVAITVSPENETFEVVDGVLFDKQQRMLMYCPMSKKGAYEVPEGTLLIDDWAFAACIGLTSVTLPDSVTSIGYNAFSECSALTSIRIPEGVTSIRAGTFDRCSNLRSVVIPDSVTGIGNGAFGNCRSLVDITIPNRVTSIGASAFTNCPGLTRVAIPASVTAIGENPFGHPYTRSNLTFIDVAPDNPVYEQIDGVLFDKQQKILIACPGTKEGEFEIPRGTLRIAASAFKSCDKLTGVTIPDGVTHIGGGAFWKCSGLTDVIIPDSVTQIGSSAFSECTGLTSATVPAMLKIYAERRVFGRGVDIKAPGERIDATGKWTYGPSGDGATIITYAGERPNGDMRIPDEVDGRPVTGIGGLAFSQCDEITSVTMPDSVTAIGDSAFMWCRNLARVTLSGNLATIGNGAFSYSNKLADVVIPDSVTSIGDNPFADCDALALLRVSPGNPAYAVVEGALFDTRKKALIFYPPLHTGEYAIPDGTLRIGYQAFTGCDGLTGVIIPDSVISIGDYAFAGCRFTSVVIPDGVTSLGDSVFRSCRYLTSVTIPASVVSISAAFPGLLSGDYPNLSLIVTKGSVAEQFAQAYDIPYVFVTE